MSCSAGSRPHSTTGAAASIVASPLGTRVPGVELIGPAGCPAVPYAIVTCGVEATRAQAGRVPAWEALLRVVELCVTLPLALIKSLLTDEPGRPELPELEAEANALIAEIAAAAQREGDLRADVPPAEVVRVLNVAVCRCGARVDDHLTRVLLDGLRASKS